MWRCLLALLSLGLCAFGVNPGMKATLTSKGLQYGADVVADWLRQRAGGLHIPDISGEIDLGLLGSVDYTLSRMRVVQFDLPGPTVGFYEGTGVKGGVANLNIIIEGDWNLRYLLIRDSGTFELGVYNVEVSLLLELGRDPAGRPSVSCLQCDPHIGGTQVNFHGGLSWIYKRFVDRFSIEQIVLNKICPMVEDSVGVLEGHLAQMKVSIQVNPSLLLEFPLINTPVVQTSDMELDLKGEFYGGQTHIEPPFTAEPFELPWDRGHMISVGVSEFSLNSAAFACLSDGLLQANITDSMIPKGSPIHLNTSNFGVFIPQLPKQFPNMLMMLLTYATEAPVVSFQPDMVTLRLSMAAKAFAIEPDNSLVPLFKLGVYANFSGKASISDGMLKGSLEMTNFTLSLDSSEVGPFETVPLQNLLSFGIKMKFLPEVNAKLRAGFPIPTTYGIHWVNLSLKVNQGFVSVVTDAQVSSAGG
ncbi:hypothetical protein AAFF_G00330650 [Aldrovandia affinis]|uniref:Bactericidal permeability-increasing protein n=1 Tax=Aldrovandia affinis TaxID=143900 RepID=A0AAD7W0K0_9TELE|nr:hypothetical protein AAFF_G00330650 [Aldrovandia affinis]